jgi:Ohr subfamily peroxiredoxin
MKTLYTTRVTARGGREGNVTSSDGVVALALSLPKELGGPGGSGTNPEQLFAGGYAACFESALRHVARSQKKVLGTTHIVAQVSLGQIDDGNFQLAVELRGHIEGLSTEETRALMEQAHQVCPYSRATRGNIEVSLIAE